VSIAVTQAYRFALDPTPRQVRDLLRHAGAARVAYNWGLARVKANLSQRAAERSYGIGEADLTPSVGWSLYSMRKDWNQAKGQVAPWWGECSKEAYNTGLDQLARALKNWADSRKRERKAAGWVSLGSNPGVGTRRRCGSPPAPSALKMTAAM
jgi:putative transposase